MFGKSPAVPPVLTSRAPSLVDLLDRAVADHPDRPAIDFHGRTYTYRRLGELVDKAACGFQQLGVRPGVRVGLCLPNTPFHVISYFAVLKAGGIVVSFNPLYTVPELKHQVEDSGTTLMVTLDLRLIYPKIAALLDDTGLERIVVCALGDVLPATRSLLFSTFGRSQRAAVPRDLRHVPFARLVENDGRLRPVTTDPARDVAVLQYTGGTTGVPKGAMLTQANLASNAEQLLTVIPDARPGAERMLVVLPLFHIYAMTVAMNLGLRIGAELILLPRFDARKVLETLIRKRATMLPGVPTLYTAVAEAAEKAGVTLPHLRVCISGGAPLPDEVRRRFEAASGCRLVEGYGLSEASPVVTCNPLDAARAGSIGLPLPGTTVEIRDPARPSRRLRDGEKGELCVRGPQVMSGYWRRPDETRTTFVDGALRTGDIGYRDPDGYLHVVDRIKDVILCGGFNVYPRMIEEALYRHPAVREAVVSGFRIPIAARCPRPSSACGRTQPRPSTSCAAF
ncbi:long-chain-fatty-acid--CoA ligase [Rhodoplanes sp. SY1]|uniref:long-chain-fatty-acid--CoA ligase n=1 Tax=Rhodoplanes sp. SY1 TaxID=3166646 RepID=UPI0038B4BBED